MVCHRALFSKRCSASIRCQPSKNFSASIANAPGVVRLRCLLAVVMRAAVAALDAGQRRRGRPAAIQLRCDAPKDFSSGSARRKAAQMSTSGCSSETTRNTASSSSSAGAERGDLLRVAAIKAAGKPQHGGQMADPLLVLGRKPAEIVVLLFRFFAAMVAGHVGDQFQLVRLESRAAGC